MKVQEIRLAGINDISEIQKTIDSVWPNSEINRDHIARVFSDPTHATLVYVSEGTVAGFVDGFMTTSTSGIQRWELDLLAVQPVFQRRGIASALIVGNMHIGQERGAKLARGLVAFDNLGSQGAFGRCGYKTDSVICELLVAINADERRENFETGKEDNFIRVNTINYKGIWIEGPRTRTQLEKALEYLANSQDDLAGAVIPGYEIGVIQDAESLGFKRVGRYQWWQRRLNEI